MFVLTTRLEKQPRKILISFGSELRMQRVSYNPQDTLHSTSNVLFNSSSVSGDSISQTENF